MSATFSGPDAAMFSVPDFSPGTVLSKSESLDLDIGFSPLGKSSQFDATLTLLTDQGAAFGVAGSGAFGERGSLPQFQRAGWGLVHFSP